MDDEEAMSVLMDIAEGLHRLAAAVELVIEKMDEQTGDDETEKL